MSAHRLLSRQSWTIPVPVLLSCTARLGNGGRSPALPTSYDDLTPADVYFGRSQIILIERERTKRQTIANRRLLHRQQAA